MKKIFIASSSEMIEEVAEPIAQALAAKKFEPVRWWKSFPVGGYTLESLESSLAKSDGGVFICGDDDKSESRGESFDIPRDNVIFELGYFLPKLGRLRCYILKSEGVKLPTDLNGLTYENIIDDIDTVATRVVSHFSGISEDNDFLIEQNQNSAIIQSDPRIAKKIFSKGSPSVNWKQRTLYLGSEGAKAWLAWAEEFKNDLSDTDVAKERDEIIKSTNADVGTYVSLGVGDADIDYDVCMKLYSKNQSFQYIPVDISDGLLHFSHSRLAGDIPIPFAILSDFEERMDFISRTVKSVSSSPVMYALLGGTFGTLDLNERKFLMKLQTKMNKGDFLVFDFVVAKGGWDFKKDKNSGRVFESTIKKQFIANGLSRIVNEPLEKVMSEFDSRVDVKNGISDISGAISYKIFDTKSKKEIMNVRRYDWGQLKEWVLEQCQKFKIDYECKFDYEDGSLGLGILRLVKI